MLQETASTTQTGDGDGHSTGERRSDYEDLGGRAIECIHRSDESVRQT